LADKFCNYLCIPVPKIRARVMGVGRNFSKGREGPTEKKTKINKNIEK